MDRTIVHLDLDTFFVSVERLQNPRLLGKPVMVGGTSDRSVVSGCSYEARQFGIHSGMSMKMAKNLCNDAVVIRGDMESYTRYSRMVTDIIAETAPVYEKASIDEHYLDITGMDRFFGSLKWTRELRQRIIKESGLPISFGLSVNKTVSKIATGEAKPNGELFIPADQVKPFINPLSIRKIPMIGQKTYQLLRTMGLSTIDALGAVPPELIEKVMGKNGIVIWQKANGIDPTPVRQYSEQVSLSTETTFETDSIDVAHMNEILSCMTEKLAYRMRKQSKLTACVTVKIRYSNFDTHTLQQRIPYTSFDHMLTPIVHDLFRRLYQRRMLIRLIGIRFSNLVGGAQQIDLFEDTPEMTSLYLAIDKVRNKYGSRSVRKAIGLKMQDEDEEETARAERK
jgi:DNA polymerase-4